MLAISRDLLNPATGNNLSETEVFNAVRRGFLKGKLQIKTTVRPRENRGKIAANGPIVSSGTVCQSGTKGKI